MVRCSWSVVCLRVWILASWREIGTPCRVFDGATARNGDAGVLSTGLPHTIPRPLAHRAMSRLIAPHDPRLASRRTAQGSPVEGVRAVHRSTHSNLSNRSISVNLRVQTTTAITPTPTVPSRHNRRERTGGRAYGDACTAAALSDVSPPPRPPADTDTDTDADTRHGLTAATTRTMHA